MMGVKQQAAVKQQASVKQQAVKQQTRNLEERCLLSSRGLKLQTASLICSRRNGHDGMASRTSPTWARKGQQAVAPNQGKTSKANSE